MRSPKDQEISKQKREKERDSQKEEEYTVPEKDNSVRLAKRSGQRPALPFKRKIP